MLLDLLPLLRVRIDTLCFGIGVDDLLEPRRQTGSLGVIVIHEPLIAIYPRASNTCSAGELATVVSLPVRARKRW